MKAMGMRCADLFMNRLCSSLRCRTQSASPLSPEGVGLQRNADMYLTAPTPVDASFSTTEDPVCVAQV